MQVEKEKMQEVERTTGIFKLNKSFKKSRYRIVGQTVVFEDEWWQPMIHIKQILLPYMDWSE